MKPQTTAVPERQTLAQIEYEARRMRAQLLRDGGVAIGRLFARLFSRGAGGGRTARA